MIVAHCNKDNEIKEEIYTINRSSNPLSGQVGYSNSKFQLSKSIAVGDCLRVFYRGSDDEEWILARRSSTQAYDKVHLCATPQEVAQSLNLEYDKESKSLSFLSEHAIQYVIKDASGGVVASNKVASLTTELIYLGALKSGVYSCSFASGGEPYELTLKL